MERAPLHETTLLRNGDGATLTVDQEKVNKNVLILSTLQSKTDIGTNHKKLPETVQFYKTKCGVNILDQMAHRYTTWEAARRWPVHVFYNILDLAAINAWIIYRGVTGKNKQACLSPLACWGITGGIERETWIYGSKHNEEEQLQDKRKASKRHQCQVGMCKRNKTTEKCEICFKFVMWKVHKNCRKEILLEEMRTGTLLKISFIVSDVSWYGLIWHVICIKHDKAMIFKYLPSLLSMI